MRRASHLLAQLGRCLAVGDTAAAAPVTAAAAAAPQQLLWRLLAPAAVAHWQALQPCRQVHTRRRSQAQAAPPRGAAALDDKQQAQHGSSVRRQQWGAGSTQQQQQPQPLLERQHSAWQQQLAGKRRTRQQQQQQQHEDAGWASTRPELQHGARSVRRRQTAAAWRDSTSSGSAGGSGVTPAGLTALIGATNSLAQLQQLLRDHASQMQQINTSAAFKAVVRLAAPPRAAGGSGDDSAARLATSSGDNGVAFAILSDLSRRMQQQMQLTRPWDLAQAAWACSKLQFTDAPLLEAIAAQAARKAPILLPRDIAQLASAYARLRYRAPGLSALLAERALRSAAGFEPWALAHTAWALHVCGADAAPLLAAGADALAERAAELSPLDVATLAWLLAGYGLRQQERLLAALAARARESLPRYPPPALAQLLLSCAALEFDAQQLAADAAPAVEAAARGGRFEPRHLAAAAFGLAKQGQGGAGVMGAAVGAFAAAPQAFCPEALLMLWWALQLARHADAAAEAQLVAQARAQLPRFTADQMASLLRVVHSAPAAQQQQEQQAVHVLLAAAAQQLPQRLPSMSDSVLTKLLLGLAKQQRRLAASASSTEQQQQLLLDALAACAGEWLQPRRLSQHGPAAATSARAALAGAGLHQLADAAGQAHEHLLAAAAAGQQQQQQQQEGQAAAAAGSTWVDSFVAASSAAEGGAHA